MKNSIIGNRLLSVSSMIRRGAVLADIGTDHAYLPIYLLSRGEISRAVCSDINEGPLATAEANLKEMGLLEKCELYLTSGVEGLYGKGITDYAVCGMGGELIASIIEAAPYLKSREVRLILQPMSRPEYLRRHLWREGYSILREVYSEEAGKYYVAMLAEFCGEREEFSDFDAYFGKNLGESKTWQNEKKKYIKMRFAALKKAVEGRREGGISTEAEDFILFEFSRRYPDL